MNALLDTHAFIWWVTAASQLSRNAKDFIANPDNKIFFSVASAWEIIIKVNTGKLNIPEEAGTYITSRLTDNRFEVLGIELAHVLQVAKLPDLHRDPFDRPELFFCEASNYLESDRSNDPELDRQAQALRTRS